MNPPSIKLDQTDKKILGILQRHAKITNAQLSKDIDLSPAPTLERVKKLENSGIIQSYHAKLNTKLLGLGISAFIQVKLQHYSNEACLEFEQGINNVQEVIECHSVTGSAAYLIKIVAKDLEVYEQVLRDKITALGNIAELNSMIILNSTKDTKVVHVP